MENPRSATTPFERHANLIAVVIVVVAFALRAWNPGSIYFNIHAERDCWRTLMLLEGESFPWTGSELTQGGRTMGPALYWLQIPPLLISLDPRGLLLWLALLHAGAVWLTYRIGREHFSPATGLAAAGLFATFPLAVLALRYVWNPSFIFPLSTLFQWAALGVFFKQRWPRLPVAIAAWCILFQVHLSAALLLLIFVLALLVYRHRIPRRWVAASVLAAALVFAPYIVGELATGFRNTRAILVPPQRLETANEADIPIEGELRRRVRFNIGAMKALQVAISPVFYDRRYETGSFSYLNMLGEFGPILLPRDLWRVTLLQHQLRWLYVAALLAGVGLLGWSAVRGRGGWIEPANGDPTDVRRRAIVLLLCCTLTTLPMLVTATMSAPKDGQSVGIGAIRYFFILYPMQFIVWALLARGATRLLKPLVGPRAVYTVAGTVAAICLLQAITVASHLQVARAKGRSFKYALYEAYDWTTIRGAADVLVKEWGITPEQFRTRTFSRRAGYGGGYYLFNSQHHDVISLEQGLDWAYYMHPDLEQDQPATHPDSYVLVFDANYPPDMTDLKIQETRTVGELSLALVASGEENRVSPIQNTWVTIRRAHRLEGPAEEGRR